MKFFGLMFFFSLAFFLQCEKGVSDAQNQSKAMPEKSVSVNSQTESNSQKTANMNEIFSAKGKQDDIEYRITGKLQKKGQYEGINYPNDNVAVEYELKNTGAKNFVVFDRGHSGSTTDVVYAEPKADGSIEISMKAFLEPKDKRCPARFVAIMPRGSFLKDGETLKDKIYVELPLTAKTPFDDCEPRAEIAANASKIKFCIGFVEAAANLQIDAEGNLRPAPETKDQKFICSGVGEIK